MKITLSNSEIKTAISLYLKANAAVDINSIEFIAKRTEEGVIAEVDTTVHAMETPVVENAHYPDMEPTPPEPEYVADDVVVHISDPTAKPYVADNTVLLCNEKVEVKETGEKVEEIADVLPWDENPAFDIDEEAEKLESVNSEPEPEPLPTSLASMFD